LSPQLLHVWLLWKVGPENARVRENLGVIISYFSEVCETTKDDASDSAVVDLARELILIR